MKMIFTTLVYLFLLSNSLHSGLLEDRLINAIEAGNFEQAQDLIKNGASIDDVILESIDKDKINVYRYLVENHLDPSLLPEVFSIVVEKNNREMVELILNHKDFNTIAKEIPISDFKSLVEKNMIDLAQMVWIARGDTDKNIPSWLYSTIDSAFQENQLEMLKFMVNFVDKNIDIKSFKALILQQAAQQHNEDAFIAIVKTGIEELEKLNFNFNPLFLAMEYDLKKALHELFRLKIDVNQPFHNSLTPLIFAIKKNDQEIINLLLQNGANPNQGINIGGKTPLFYAIDNNNIDIFRLLLEYKADPNYQGTLSGGSLLNFLLRTNKKDYVKELLHAKADPNLIDMFGNSPLKMAITWGPAASDEKKETIYLDSEYVDLLIQAGADPNLRVDGKTPLYDAIINYRLDVVDILLAGGADPKLALDENGTTALMLFAQTGKISYITKLVDHYGVQIDQTNNEGDTAIGFATKKGKINIVEFLLLKGGNINIVNNRGNTLLHLASYASQLEMVKYLLLKGLDINAVNSKGIDPLTMAIRNDSPELVNLLLDAEVSEQFQEEKVIHTWDVSARYGYISILESLKQRKDKQEVMEKGHKKAWFSAAGSGKDEILAWLKDQEVEIDLTDNDGKTALFYACRSPGEEKALEWLLAQGANVNHQDNYENTPLMEAVKFGNSQGVNILLKTSTININIQNNRNETALILAEKNEKPNPDIIKALLDAGAQTN